MEETPVKRGRSRETNMSDARPQGRRRKISPNAVLGERKTKGKEWTNGVS